MSFPGPMMVIFLFMFTENACKEIPLKMVLKGLCKGRQPMFIIPLLTSPPPSVLLYSLPRRCTSL